MAHRVQIVKGVVHAQLQMLRGDLVGDVNGLHQILRHDDLAVVVDGGSGDLRPLQLWDLLFQLFGNRPGKFCRVQGVEAVGGEEAVFEVEEAQEGG